MQAWKLPSYKKQIENVIVQEKSYNSNTRPQAEGFNEFIKVEFKNVQILIILPNFELRNILLKYFSI